MSNSNRTPEEVGAAIARHENVTDLRDAVRTPTEARRALSGLLNEWLRESVRREKKASDAIMGPIMADMAEKERERRVERHKAELKTLQGEVLEQFVEVARLQGEIDLLQGRIDRRPNREELVEMAKKMQEEKA